MKAKLLCCFIAVGLASSASFAASPGFEKAFSEGLLQVSQDAGNDVPGKPLVIPQVMDDLRKLGTNTEIGDAIAKALRGPVNQEWDAALNLSGLLGQSYDRTAITSAVRDSFPRLMVVGTRQITILNAANHLCSYGTQEDLPLLKQYAVQIRRKNKTLADMFDTTLLLGEGNRRFIESHQTPSGGRGAPPSSQHGTPISKPNVDPPKHHSVEPSPIELSDQVNSITWSTIIAFIMTVLGLLWLLLKRRS